MGEIYAKANYVITWLGSEFNNVHLGAEMLDHYGRQLPLPKNADEHHYKAVEQLYADDYWSRRWIVQEVLQGKSVVVHVAGYECSLTTMGEFALDANFPWPQDTYINSVRARLRQTLAVRLYEHRQAGKQQITLTNMLLSYRTTICADAHDTVFAFLSLTPKLAAHINADYDTDIVDLMVEVLRIASRLESLPPQKIVSFAVFLRHQFGIDKSTLSEYASRFHVSGAQPLQGLKAEVRVRGPATEQLSPKQEQLVVAIRGKSRPLVHLEPFTLEGSHEEGLYRLSRRLHRTSSASSHPSNLVKVSSQDLCAFGWRSQQQSRSFFGSATSNNEYVGLATAPVQQGDEVWQFQDTDVAVVMRYQHPSRCTVVARALLYRQPALLDRVPSEESSDRGFLERAWSSNTSNGLSKGLQLDALLLLRLLLWVDMTQD